MKTIAARLAVLVAGALALPSCFYDSRWLQARQAQANAAKNATPSALHATPGTETDLGAAPAARLTRTLKLRAHATPRYAAEVTDWPRQLEGELGDVNEILGPTLGIRLEIAAAEPWSPRRTDDDLYALGAELAALDPGEGVDWVVGLVGSVPRVEISFHQLGLGQVNGKHFLVRAMSDAHDYEAIQRVLTGISEQERAKLYRARKRHKSAAVFLHELGHTLGAPHEIDVQTLMYHRYDPKGESYSPAAAQLMKITLDHRIDPSAQSDQEVTRALLDHLRRTEASWVPAERDEAIAQLEGRLRASAPPPPRPVRERPPLKLGRPDEAAPAAAAAPASGEDPVAALAPGDRAVFQQVVEAQRAGQNAEAWSKLEPLFKAYPDVVAVQDLRCRMATTAGGTWDEIKGHCERWEQLTKGSAPKRKRR